MNQDLDKGISGLINDRVENEFKKIEADARNRVESRIAGLEKYEKDSRDQIDERLKGVEERVTRDVRTRVFSVALMVVVIAAGAMLAGSFAATRDVNNAVIALQDRVLGAQATVQKSTEALNTVKDQMEVSKRQLETIKGQLDDAKTLPSVLGNVLIS
jgi:hypothetical protein